MGGQVFLPMFPFFEEGLPLEHDTYICLQEDKGVLRQHLFLERHHSRYKEHSQFQSSLQLLLQRPYRPAFGKFFP